MKIEYISQLEKEDVKISLINLLGHVLITQKDDLSKGRNTIELQTENLQKGIYLIKISSENSEVIKRIIID